MKLKKYENKELRKSKIAFFVLSGLCIILLFLFVYQSYANYQMKATFRIINGKLKMSGGKGDIEFAFYNGDQKIDTMPSKDNEEGIVFVKAECTNDAVIKWNDEDWDNILVNNLKKTKTNCSIYFGSIVEKACTLAGEESVDCELAKRTKTDKQILAYDNTNDKNLRFVGSDPKNYVYFNCEEGKEASKDTCETWRIIGIMNNIKETNGNTGSHIKIIRDSIGKYSWDSSQYNVNSGSGVNEWSQADIEKVLNNEYLNKKSGNNKCYIRLEDVAATCPTWTEIGINVESRNMIASVKWNTGTMPVVYDENRGLITASYMYEAERSGHHGREGCSNATANCTDRVDRTTTWSGKVGLMYPSDYGYAVGGDVREACLGKSMASYSSFGCVTNDWLYDKSNAQWTITPSNYSSHAGFVFNVNSSGDVNGYYTYFAYAVRPVVYLSPSVKIIDGSGDINDPIVLGM